MRPNNIQRKIIIVHRKSNDRQLSPNEGKNVVLRSGINKSISDAKVNDHQNKGKDKIQQGNFN